jgi:hypothetical protein
MVRKNSETMFSRPIYRFPEFQISPDTQIEFLNDLKKVNQDIQADNSPLGYRCTVFRNPKEDPYSLLSGLERADESRKWAWNDIPGSSLVQSILKPLKDGEYVREFGSVFFNETDPCFYPHIDSKDLMNAAPDDYHVVKITMAESDKEVESPALYWIDGENVEFVTSENMFWGTQYPTSLHGTVPRDFRRGVLTVSCFVNLPKWKGLSKVPMAVRSSLGISECEHSQDPILKAVFHAYERIGNERGTVNEDAVFQKIVKSILEYETVDYEKIRFYSEPLLDRIEYSGDFKKRYLEAYHWCQNVMGIKYT